MADRGVVALAAHLEYRNLGYEPLPIRLDRIVDDRGEEKKRPRFPGGTWETAREIGMDADRLKGVVGEGYVDLAIVCGRVVALDFDQRDEETREELQGRVRAAVDQYRLKGAVVEETARGYHVLTRAPAPNGTPWRKLVWGAPHLVDEIQVGDRALLFVAPSEHPLTRKPYRRLTSLRDVDELPECPVELLHDPEESTHANGSRPDHRPRGLSGDHLGRGLWSSLDIVGLFQESGLYVKDLGGGKHGVRCPWDEGHTTGSDGTDTSIWDPDGATGPGFKCLHAHCEGRGIRDVREWFGAETIDRWCTEEYRAPESSTVSTNGTGLANATHGSVSPSPNNGEDTDTLTLTDSGNSSRLVDLHGERLHHIAPWNKWVSQGPDGFWDIDHGDVRVRELAKDVGRKVKLDAAREPDEDRAKKLFAWGLGSLNSHRIGALVNLARGIDGIPLNHEQLDADGWVLGVENGVVDLRTGELRAPRPSDLITRRCPVAWDEDAKCPRWDQAMGEWFPDGEVGGYVRRLAGAGLPGEQRDHVLAIHYGGGGNGKGTFVGALQNVLGPYAIVVHLSLLVDERHKEHDTVKAQLFRARLALASETKQRVRLDEASVKNLTGGDRITARRMREDPWEFDPTHSLWLQTNHLPEIGGRDEGIWRRIRVVKWVNHFKGQNEDRDLKSKLRDEAPGILRWLVEGCLEWQREGLQEPEAVIRETLAYRRAEDTFSRFQADMGIAFRPDLRIRAEEIQDMLTRWANEEGIDPPRQEMGEWLRENGCRQKRERWTDGEGKARQNRFWRGIGVEGVQSHENEQTDVLA